MKQNIDPKAFGKVVVLMGGSSNERDISLITGARVLEALLAAKVDACELDVRDDVISQLQKMKPDRVFLALHGYDGEDGRIQAVLEMLGIKYTSSGVFASGLTLHKPFANAFWREYGLQAPPCIILDHENDLTKIKKTDLPLCIKPTNSGSSCGVTKLQDFSQLKEAYYFAKSNTTATVMAEPWINGREFTVGIIGDEALPVIEITSALEFYDYKAKYLIDSTKYSFPEDLTAVQHLEIQQAALKAFRLAQCRYWGRADFILDNDGKFWLLEVNTIPGMTTHSLLPMAANKVGIGFNDLVLKILSFTLDN